MKRSPWPASTLAAETNGVAITPEVVDPETTPAQASRAAVRAAGGHGLGRQQVLDAAVAFIDERGLKELSMRRLGAYLGVDAMALYRYLPSKEILLDGIVELVTDELYSDPDVHLSIKRRVNDGDRH